MYVADLTIDYEKDEEYVQGLIFDGTINAEFNFGLNFGIYTLKITGFNTIGILLKDILFANNNNSLYFSDISIFYKNVGCAIFFQENSSILFQGNYNIGFYFFPFFKKVIFHIHFLLDNLFEIKAVYFNYLLNSEPSQENSTVIYFGSSFIFENNSVENEILFIGDIYCENLYIGNILYFKADFHFKEDNSSDGTKNIYIFLNNWK